MFGTREEFDYVECKDCGTIQIKELIDVSKYYPDDYYSLDEGPKDPADGSIKRRFALKQIGRHYLGKFSIFGGKLAASRPYLAERFPYYLRKPYAVDSEARILDVGSGNGKLLRTLKYFGFSNLTGVDPFLKVEVSEPGLNLIRSAISDLNGAWDRIMFHHTLEHVPDPRSSLTKARELLAPNGKMIVRIPIASFAWKTYGKNWFQLDPPRHIYTFTEPSFRLLAGKAGLAVDSVLYDSELAQFTASEQYAHDISLLDERAYRDDVERSIFTREKLELWEKQVVELNETGQGDQACFFLSRN